MSKNTARLIITGRPTIFEITQKEYLRFWFQDSDGSVPRSTLISLFARTQGA